MKVVNLKKEYRKTVKDTSALFPAENGKAEPPKGGTPNLGELRTAKWDACLRSPTNPRKSFPEASLKELAESILSQGIQHALLVRPWPQFAPMKSEAWTQENWEAGKPDRLKAGLQTFEIVDGERRHRAAEIAGIPELPIIVKDLTDAQVVEIQLISFLQREDVSALEEGESYRSLIESKIHTVESLMAKLGKSRAHVYGRLALCKASGPVKAAMEKGEIDATVAQLIAGVPTEALQKELLEYATDEWDKPSFRDVKQTIEDDYLQNLKAAVFKLDELVIVPGVKVQPTTCEGCPKRTGNIPGAEGSPNVCTDVACFKAKQAAAIQVKLEAAKSEGRKVVGVEEYRKARHGTFREANETCYDDDRRRTYGELAKKAGVETLLTASEKGMLGVYGSGEVATMLEKAGIKKESSGRSTANDLKAKEKLKAEQARLQVVADQALVLLREKVSSQGLNKTILGLMAEKCAYTHHYLERHKLDRQGHPGFLKHVRTLNEKQLQVAIVEGSFCDPLVGYYDAKFGDEFENACKAYGIDLAKLAKAAAKPKELPGAEFEQAAAKHQGKTKTKGKKK